MRHVFDGSIGRCGTAEERTGELEDRATVTQTETQRERKNEINKMTEQRFNSSGPVSNRLNRTL